jgi:hypothetical protein
MKLSELKSALIEQFFPDHLGGVSANLSDEILGELLSTLAESTVELSNLTSRDPGKAFHAFIQGKNSTLTIIDEESGKPMLLFAAARAGKTVTTVNLTTEDRKQRQSDLVTVKQALRQAKNRNDEIYFSISHN